MSKTRLFAGIPVTGALSDRLLLACEAIRKADPSWRNEKWVIAENLHVTLKFIGWIDDERVEDVIAGVGRAADALLAFELPFVGIRAVPTPRRARMLWTDFLDPTGDCTALAEAIERAVLPFGVEPESRAFSPHATLVRARRPKPIAGAAMSAAGFVLEPAPRSMSVPSASLFSSRLTPQGPLYTQVASWQLGG